MVKDLLFNKSINLNAEKTKINFNSERGFYFQHNLRLLKQMHNN